MLRPPADFVPFVPVGRPDSIVARFRTQVARHPRRIAIATPARRIDYAALESWSNRIAAGLRGGGVGPGDRVAILLGQGEDSVAATIAILKLGAAYVPLDPAWPAERIRTVVDDAEPARVLVGGSRRDALADGLAAPVIAWESLDRGDDEAPSHAIASEAAASIYYTSGTTGGPKGVVGDHRSIIDNVRRYTEALGFAPSDRLSMIQSPAFSGAASSLFGALLNGGTLCPFDLATEGVAALGPWIDAMGITIFHAVPALFEAAVAGEARLASLRVLRLEGDRTAPRHVDLFKRRCAPDCVLAVGLGATETGLVSQFLIDRNAAGVGDCVPLGRPASGIEVALVDETGCEVAAGGRGRIVVRGAFLAPGYWRRPDEDAARFRALPGRPGWREFRSADLGRRRPDGLLEFLGRDAEEVRIRGARVEVDRLEAALCEHPDVAAAVVVAAADAAGEDRLVAHVVARAGAAPRLVELRERLAGRFPPAMLPALFVRLERLPLGEHGKLDRRALPPPVRDRLIVDSAYRAPRDSLEAALAGVWAATLGLTRPGIDDRFEALGGDSLAAATLAAAVEDVFAVRIPVAAVFADGGTIAGMAALVRAARRGPVAEPAITSAPLSLAQERLWFLYRLDPTSPAYNVPLAFRLRGPLDAERLETALRNVVRAHDALRIRIEERDGMPRQTATDPALEVVRRDLARLGGDDAFASARGLADELAARPFELGTGPPCRAAILRLGAQDHLLIFVAHHIAFDEGSAVVLAAALSRAYHDRTAAEAERAGSFLARAKREREAAAAERRDDLAYWTALLAGAPEGTSLLGARPPRTRALSRAAVSRRALAAAATPAFAALCARHRVTRFMALLAGFVALAQRQTGEHDIVLGTAVAMRPDAESAATIGFHTNLLALRIECRPDDSFAALLARVRGCVLDALAHGAVPFDRVVAAVAAGRDPLHGALLRTTFAVERDSAAGLLLPGVTVEPLHLSPGAAKFELGIVVTDARDAVTVTAEYASDGVAGGEVDGLLLRYERLLSALVAAPDAVIAAPALLDERETAARLAAGTGPRSPFEATTIDALVARQIARRPDRPALRHRARSTSYRELDAAADALARRIAACGAEPGVAVAICLDRSIEMVVAMLAVLRCGMSYLPLDPAHDSDRLRRMLCIARVRIAICTAASAPVVAADGVHRLVLDADDAPAPAPPLRRQRGPEDVAVVMFTSGSSGTPKGVALTHAGLVNLVSDRHAVPIEPDDVVAQAANASFDAATFEIWGALAHGATLAILDRETVLDAPALAAAIAEHGITAALLPTAVLHRTIDRSPAALGRLRLLWFGGEKADARRIRALLASGRPARILHAYGPAEASTFVAVHEVTELDPEAASVPIGRPIANAGVFVLDDRLRPVAPGMNGEICIAGVPLAVGYVDRPDLTAAAFVTAPFDGGRRIYRTGDVGRVSRDGILEYVGRRDGQVKIRGIRVELDEIAAALRAIGGVRDAIVFAEPGGAGGDAELAACVVADAIDERALRAALARRLPSYMVPARIVTVDALPLTANGKIDRAALAGLVPFRRPPPAAGAEARNAVEAELMRLWERILPHRPTGPQDDFFSLGGHSLLAATMLHRAERILGRPASLAGFFRDPTIAGLAAASADPRAPSAVSGPVEIVGAGAAPPLFFAHAHFGGGAFCRDLARAFGDDQPFYALPPPGLEDMPASLAALAARDAAAIRRVAPRGPWVLVGHCSGGLRVLAIATALRQGGGDVDLVVMIATPSLMASRLAAMLAPIMARHRRLAVLGHDLLHRRARLGALWRAGPGATLRFASAWLGRKLEGWLRGPTSAATMSTADPNAAAHARMAEVRGRYADRVRLHRPDRYDGPVLCLVAADEPDAFVTDPARWRRLVPRLDVDVIEGDHDSVLTTHRAGTASAIKRRLAATKTGREAPPLPR